MKLQKLKNWSTHANTRSHFDQILQLVDTLEPNWNSISQLVDLLHSIEPIGRNVQPNFQFGRHTRTQFALNFTIGRSAAFNFSNWSKRLTPVPTKFHMSTNFLNWSLPSRPNPKLSPLHHFNHSDKLRSDMKGCCACQFD